VVTGLRGRGATVATGRFGAMMAVRSVNDGPFTVLLEL
jgi:D-tyrosyl-tRNA(Tyr) deacylase